MNQQISHVTPENFAITYANFPNLSMEYRLAEKAEKVAVVPIDMALSDLGSWDSIYAQHEKDTQNMDEGANFKIKHIVVNLGTKLSMQLHKHRPEHWVVISGEAIISNNETE